MSIVAVVALDIDTTTKGFEFDGDFRANCIAAAQRDLVMGENDLGAMIVEDCATTESMFSAFFTESFIQAATDRGFVMVNGNQGARFKVRCYLLHGTMLRVIVLGGGFRVTDAWPLQTCMHCILE